MGLISELRRRNVFRMAVLYAVAAWLIVQVAGVLIDLAHLPDWIGPAILGLLAVGFPIALIFSWFYELTPEGIGLEKDVDPAESITHVTGRRLDFIVISLLCAAVILFAYDKWWTTSPPEQSIAVLPFVNLSDDPEQEYFSDGLAEDILNLLVKVPQLRVISRSSAFSFKGQNLDVPTMAARLNVAHVLEGSVRKSGDQLRVTAQLIEVETDTHMWSQTYDRDLQNVFVIQDDIAMAVVGALKIALLGRELKSTETDPEAYALYLQGRHIYEHGGAERISRAEPLLKQAISLDPGFAPAWAELGNVYSLQAQDSTVRLQGRTRDEAWELARDASEQALAIDPRQARAYAVLGELEIHETWDFTAADKYMQRALALNPGDTFVVANVAHMEALMGRHDSAINLYRQMVALDPVRPRAHRSTGLWYYSLGRVEEAADSYELANSLMPDRPAPPTFGLVLLAQGDARGALAVMEQWPSDFQRLWGTAIVQHALGDTGASDAALEEFIEMYEAEAHVQIAEIYAFRSEVDHAFFWLEQAYDNRDTGLPFMLVRPLLNNLHDDPRWETLLKKMGLPH